MRKPVCVALAIMMTAPVLAYPSTPEITAGFSPTADKVALKIVINAIDGAESSIDMAAYSFTSKPVAAALVAAKNRGVTVRVVADQKANSDRYTAITHQQNDLSPLKRATFDMMQAWCINSIYAHFLWPI